MDAGDTPAGCPPPPGRLHHPQKVKAKTRKEAERVGTYMIRPLLSLERLSLDEKEGKVSYHLKLTFLAERPPPPHLAYQEVLLAAEQSAEYFS